MVDWRGEEERETVGGREGRDEGEWEGKGRGE